MTALEWNLLKSATDKVAKARAALSEEQLAQAILDLDITARKLLKRPATREDLTREEAAR